MPFEFLNKINAEAGVKKEMTVAELKRRIEPFGIEIAAQGYARLAEKARSQGVKLFWLYLPGPTDDKKEVDALRNAAEAAGFTIIDLYGRYEAKLYPRTRLDPSHPSIEGHRVIADMVYEDLLQLEAAGKTALGLKTTAVAPAP
jgi:lysophospholipase L1-like esterase